MKRAAKRVGLEVLGWALVLAGIAALILPGPGLLMLFGGLAVLSQQYDWAAKRVDPVKFRALKGAAQSVENARSIALSVLGVVLLVAAGVLWTVRPPEPDWWMLPESWWLPGGLATAITQYASAVIAGALIVYSYRRFHGHPDAVEELENDYREAVEARHAS